jgi:phosphoribosyl 1,2-cyclic phosphodiesterase
MRLVPLASGSRGNASLIELGGRRLVFDAGISARSLARRLEAVGVAPERVDALVLSHEHEDHARGAERFSRAHRVPVVCSMRTLEALDRSPTDFAAWEPLAPGGRLDLGAVQIDSFAVPHDAAEPAGFVVHGEGLRIGFATDVGHATALVVERLRGCHVQLVEANHDDRLLRDGPYPWSVKQRVAGRLGHLSNREAAALLARTVGEVCRAVVLAHLSEMNNRPALARSAVALALAAGGARRCEMRIALGDRPTPGIEL